MNAICNRDIIITGLQPWDIEIGSNCKNIAMEFSKHNRVLYINSPIDFITSVKDRHDPKISKRNDITRRKAEGLVKINDNLWNFYPGKNVYPLNQLKNNTIFDIFNRINNKRFAGEIKKAIKKLGFRNFILFNDSDMFKSFYLKEMLEPACYIYYTRDNLLAVKYWQTQGKRIEPLHMAKSDLVVSNSKFLARLASSFNPESHFVGQGCDVTAFKSENVNNLPADIASIKYPVIGYIGALKALRLDINVIEHIARTRKDWNIVLVGPEDDKFRASSLHNMDNVHFLGPKNEADLPAYLKAFDVAINPQILNEVTVGNYPRKIDEYLAMGKPTVATRTEAMEYFSTFVSLAEDKDEWVEAIAEELKNDNSEVCDTRVEFAGGHTWENNVNEIYKLIEKVK